MALVPVFHAEVSADGKLVPVEAERGRRRAYLQSLAGTQVEYVIRPHRRRRSDRQNRWHWGIAVPLIAVTLGYDRHEHEDVHYALVAKCFGTHVDPVLQQELPNKRSSALKTTEFSELMEWEVRWAAQELNLVIPLPNEAEMSA